MAAQPTLENQSVYVATKRLIEAALDDFPPFPVVASKVLEATQSEEVSASTVEQILGADQALSAKILRTANSAYFGMSKKVSSLNQAVMLLGFSQIRSLVVGLSVASLFRATSPTVRDKQLEMWRESFGTACALRFMSSKGIVALTPDVAFTGGLMTGIGSLFMLHAFTGQYLEAQKIADARQLSRAAAESYLFGINHANLGAMLAEKWKLPADIIAIIAEHEGPYEDGSMIGRCTGFANRVAEQFVCPNSGEITVINEPLEFDEELFAEICEAVRNQVDSTAEFLGID